MTALGASLLVSRAQATIRPDPTRVIARLFVPGQEHLIHGQARVDPVLSRILALDREAAAATLAATLDRFAGRHTDLRAVLQEHFDLVAHRLDAPSDLPTTTQLLVGAYFTQEYAVEAAAVFNPSIVEHPDQDGMPAGALRVVISLRGVGEGHVSSIEFRTGTVFQDATLHIEDPGHLVRAARQQEATYDRELFRRMIREFDDRGEDTEFALDSLPDQFTQAELDAALVRLHDQIITRHSADRVIERLRWIASCNYQVAFPCDSVIGERVLMPVGPTESHGMEDARFVRFTDDDGTIIYYATYTAFDGGSVAPQLLRTNDFRTFTVSQISGPAARNKGMALFPRRLRGRYVALSRWDRENISVTSSADGGAWDQPVTVVVPGHAWDLIQLGNCGSPVETPAGWLVLTHGVGPMRAYAIGAILLDLDDPTRVIGRLAEPLLEATDAERDGYVPNVLYSCGAIAHNGRLVVPYGSADNSVGVAVFDLAQLLQALGA